MNKISWTKEQLKDTKGRLLTQSLFLEIGYRTEYAVFTLNDEDKVYDGRTYPSLRKWFLQIGDPTEYEFATTCLAGWHQWQRLCANRMLKPYIRAWRDELEIALRSEGIKGIIAMTANENGNFQASKWLADKGWDRKIGAGRPTKKQLENEDAIEEAIAEDLKETVLRMEDYTKVA